MSGLHALKTRSTGVESSQARRGGNQRINHCPIDTDGLRCLLQTVRYAATIQAGCLNFSALGPKIEAAGSICLRMNKGFAWKPARFAAACILPRPRNH